MITVAERLRQAAACSGGIPHGIFVTSQFLLELAKELEPDYFLADPAIHAMTYYGEYEALGKASNWPRCEVHYWFIDRPSADAYIWIGCYERGYRPPKRKLPAIRPRIRVKMGRMVCEGRVELPCPKATASETVASTNSAIRT
jgi:hypothetical protein